MAAHCALCYRPPDMGNVLEPEHVVRNIWRLYGGWWDGQPAHSKPAREAEIGQEVAALAERPGARDVPDARSVEDNGSPAGQ